MHGRADSPATVLAVYMDVDERKQAEAALHDAARRKDEFLAMLAHELRNPLAPIRAAAEMLGMAQLDAARIRRTSEIIGRQVRHMTGADRRPAGRLARHARPGRDRQDAAGPARDRRPCGRTGAAR